MPSIINALSTGSGGLVQTADASGILQLQTNGTTALTVDTSQNVGIGTSSPSTRLEVSVADGANAQRWIATTGRLRLRPYVDATIGALFESINAAENAYLPLSLYGSTVRMGNGAQVIIDSSGNLLVGTTTTPSASVNGVRIGGPGSNFWISSNAGTSSYGHMLFYNANGLVGSITTSGSTTSYNTSSDYRLKENIQPMTGALAKVAALKPVTYTWKADGSAGEGFIAHELAEVCPQAVTGEKDAVDAEGNPQYQGIDVSFLVGTLTAAIQELKAELDTVKAELSAMKGN